MLTPQTIRIGDRYNWKNQPERLTYIGAVQYPRDGRLWFQFEKVDEPGKVWCEVLASDLPHFEETLATGVKEVLERSAAPLGHQAPQGAQGCVSSPPDAGHQLGCW